MRTWRRETKISQVYEHIQAFQLSFGTTKCFWRMGSLKKKHKQACLAVSGHSVRPEKLRCCRIRTRRLQLYTCLHLRTRVEDKDAYKKHNDHEPPLGWVREVDMNGNCAGGRQPLSRLPHPPRERGQAQAVFTNNLQGEARVDYFPSGMHLWANRGKEGRPPKTNRQAKTPAGAAHPGPTIPGVTDAATQLLPAWLAAGCLGRGLPVHPTACGTGMDPGVATEGKANFLPIGLLEARWGPGATKQRCGSGDLRRCCDVRGRRSGPMLLSAAGTRGRWGVGGGSHSLSRQTRN